MGVSESGLVLHHVTPRSIQTTYIAIATNGIPGCISTVSITISICMVLVDFEDSSSTCKLDVSSTSLQTEHPRCMQRWM
jgi:hypothetical protein